MWFVVLCCDHVHTIDPLADARSLFFFQRHGTGKIYATTSLDLLRQAGVCDNITNCLGKARRNLDSNLDIYKVEKTSRNAEHAGILWFGHEQWNRRKRLDSSQLSAIPNHKERVLRRAILQTRRGHEDSPKTPSTAAVRFLKGHQNFAPIK